MMDGLERLTETSVIGYKQIMKPLLSSPLRVPGDVLVITFLASWERLSSDL